MDKIEFGFALYLRQFLWMVSTNNNDKKNIVAKGNKIREVYLTEHFKNQVTQPPCLIQYVINLFISSQAKFPN